MKNCTDLSLPFTLVHLKGAHSVMIARAAETNPTCFSSTPMIDLEKTLWPKYLRLVGRFLSFDHVCHVTILSLLGKIHRQLLGTYKILHSPIQGPLRNHEKI